METVFFAISNKILSESLDSFFVYFFFKILNPSTASFTTDSMSAPLKPSVSSLKASDIFMPSFLRFFRCTSKICLRSLSSGNFTQNISSNLPFRFSSGGRLAALLAVARTYTLDVFSCIHERKYPNIRVRTSLPPTPVNAFSISSIHKMHGAAASAIFIACRRFFSLSP